MQTSTRSARNARRRDPATERRERQRYLILRGVYERTGAHCGVPVSGLAVGEELGISREETFRSIHFLADRGYLDYIAAGPRVCITAKAIEYLEQQAGRRQSLRDG